MANPNMPPTPQTSIQGIDPDDLYNEIEQRGGKVRACDLAAELMDSDDHQRRGQFSYVLSAAIDQLESQDRIHFRCEDGNKYWILGPGPGRGAAS